MNCLIHSPVSGKSYLPVPLLHSPARLPPDYRSADHRHNVYHLVFIRSGDGILETDTAPVSLSPGDIVCIDPGRRHIFRTRKSPLAYYAFNFYLVPSGRIRHKKITPEHLAAPFPESAAATEPLHRLFGLHRRRGLLEYSPADLPGINSHITDGHAALDAMKSSLTAAGPAPSAPQYSRYLYRVFTFLGTILFTLLKSDFSAGPPPEPAMVRQVRAFLRQHPDRPFRLADFTGITGYHPAYLSAAFKKCTGISLNTFINRHKCGHAAHLLETTGLSVTDIALQSGYSSSQHLAMRFKEIRGISPRQHRQRTGTI